jgi:Na+/H+ antiporter NhaA
MEKVQLAVLAASVVSAIAGVVVLRFAAVRSTSRSRP